MCGLTLYTSVTQFNNDLVMNMCFYLVAFNFKSKGVKRFRVEFIFFMVPLYNYHELNHNGIKLIISPWFGTMIFSGC